MKAVINKKTYNTETAKLVGTYYQGTFGDPEGFEERLYETKKGEFFIYGLGGADSKYPKENLEVISKKDAGAWTKAHPAK